MAIALLALNADRPGLAHELGELVHGHGGNIETSRMVTLGAEFAIAALVEAVRGDEAALMETLRTALAERGYTVVMRPTARPRPAVAVLPCVVRALSLDHPGIVDRLAAAIRANGGNVVDAETDVLPAPWSGAPTFTFRAKVLVPDAEAVRRLRSVLADVAAAENLDVEVEPLGSRA